MEWLLIILFVVYLIMTAIYEFQKTEKGEKKWQQYKEI